MDQKAYLLYLHGFLSSPQSKKAQETVEFCENFNDRLEIYLPLMGSGPAETIKQLENLIQSLESKELILMGSSLGGYYATYLSEKYNCPAALINPAVRPFELWESHLGEHKNFYSDDIHLVTHQHIEELRDLEVKKLSNPDNFLILVQTDDETLDYRDAVQKFSSSLCWVRENGNHSYEKFAEELPEIFDFLLSRIG
jgi:predicted esterase YcpF (UPF0227 family)